MTLLHTLKKAHHIDHLLHKGLTFRIFRTDINIDELTSLHDRALILAVEPLPPNLCAVAYLPRANKNPLKQTPPDADDSTHSQTTPDTDSDTAPNTPSDHPVVWDSNPSETTPQTPSDPLQKYPFITPSQDPEKPEPVDPHINPISTDQINRLTSPSEQSLQAIRRAETTDFDHGFTKPFHSPSHTQPQPAFDPDDSVVTSDDLPPPTSSAENPSDSPLPFAALCDDSSPD